MPPFQLKSDYQPMGDQPGAIAKLIEGVNRGDKNQVLLGATGSGKTFTIANVVEYFVSYYDYYQPEAYVARHDLYIEKETQINEEIDRLRLAATASLLSRRDVLIVASVSCIYGLGSPDAWRKYRVELKVGET